MKRLAYLLCIIFCFLSQTIIVNSDKDEKDLIEREVNNFEPNLTATPVPILIATGMGPTPTQTITPIPLPGWLDCASGCILNYVQQEYSSDIVDCVSSSYTSTYGLAAIGACLIGCLFGGVLGIPCAVACFSGPLVMCGVHINGVVYGTIAGCIYYCM